MKTPEWIWSTPRLIVVLLTLGLLYFTHTKNIESTVYKDIALLVFGYFFGSRGSESSSIISPNTVSITDTTHDQKSIDNMKQAMADKVTPLQPQTPSETEQLSEEDVLALNKAQAYDPNNQ